MDVLEYIQAYKTYYCGDSPTLRQIAAACEISSTSVVSHILRRLEQDGKIKRTGAGIALPGWEFAQKNGMRDGR
jgi:DNA-binding Lrp family transcriptional regulator